jgi:predicted lipoprotein
MTSRSRLSTLARLTPLGLVWSCSLKEPLDEHVRPLGAADTRVTGVSGAPSNPMTPSAGGGNGAVPSAGGAPAASGSGGSLNSGGSSPNATAGSGSTAPPPRFSKRGLREALADCALSSYREFGEAALALVNATEALAAEPSASPDAARLAWLNAMASWQRAEPLRFGPAARSGEPGGQNLRDEIYSFPLANYCRVDQQIVNRSYANETFPTSLSSARGLAAIEYLLFHTGSTNACSSAIAINVNGDWAALSDADLAQRRFDYAARASRDVLERANALIGAWEPDAGNFYAQFVDAGRSGGPFGTEQRAFNAVSDALLYVEKEVKDWKLGWPLGLVPECLNAPSACPSEVESRYARVSTDHVRQNLVGFQRAFEGCSADGAGLGFDDWLNAVGAEDLANRMLSALDGARSSVESLNPPIEPALLQNPESVRALHQSVKGLTDLLKTEFITVLDFELPMALEGDND